MNCEHDTLTDGWFWMPVEYARTTFYDLENGVRFATEQKEVTIKLLPRMTHVCVECGWVFPFEAFIHSSHDEAEIKSLLTTWGEDLLAWHDGDSPPPIFHINEEGCSPDFIKWYHGGEEP